MQGFFNLGKRRADGLRFDRQDNNVSAGNTFSYPGRAANIVAGFNLAALIFVRVNAEQGSCGMTISDKTTDEGSFPCCRSRER